MLNRIYLCPFHFVTLFNFVPSYFIYSFPLLYFVSIQLINSNTLHPVFNHSIYFCFGYFITCVEVVTTPPHFTNYKKLFSTPQKFT